MPLPNPCIATAIMLMLIACLLVLVKQRAQSALIFQHMTPALPFKVTSEGIGNRRSIKKLNSSGIFFLWRPNLPLSGLLSQGDIHHPFLDKPEIISILRNDKSPEP